MPPVKQRIFMEPLYTTQFAHTLDEHIKFNKAVLKSQKSFIVLYILFAVLSIGLGILSYNMVKNIIFSIFLALLFFILLLITFPSALKKSIKKAYYSNKTIDSEISDYKFYETEFTETDSHGSVTFPYTDLSQIIETKTNFYLMISKQQGYLIKKENCSTELIAFLSELKNKIH